MSKCLVTRLKASVNNPNLKKLGEMVYTLEPGNVGWEVSPDNEDLTEAKIAKWPVMRMECMTNTEEPAQIEIIEGDAEFYRNRTAKSIKDDPDGARIGNTVTQQDVQDYAVLLRVKSQKKITFRVSNKYTVGSLGGSFDKIASGLYAKIDADDLHYSTGLLNLTNLDFGEHADLSKVDLANVRNFLVKGADVSLSKFGNAITQISFGSASSPSGDLSTLAGLKDLSLIVLRGDKVTGSVEDLWRLTKLTHLRLESTPCTGDLAVMANKMSGSGIESGTPGSTPGSSPVGPMNAPSLEGFTARTSGSMYVSRIGSMNVACSVDDDAAFKPDGTPRYAYLRITFDNGGWTVSNGAPNS